jgi:hypothetical protein
MLGGQIEKIGRVEEGKEFYTEDTEGTEVTQGTEDAEKRNSGRA